MLHTEDIIYPGGCCCCGGCVEFILDLSHPSLQLHYLTSICLFLPGPGNNLGSIIRTGLVPESPLTFGVTFLGCLVVSHYCCCYHFIVIITTVSGSRCRTSTRATRARITEKDRFLLLKDEVALSLSLITTLVLLITTIYYDLPDANLSNL